MIISKQLFQDKYIVPENFINIKSHDLMEKLGFSELVYSGFPMFGPIGRRIINYISDIIKEEAEKSGFSEIYLPLVQDKKYFQKSGRDKIFMEEFMELSNLENFILTPTNEEVFLYIAGKGIRTYKQMPTKLFQIADKFRNIKSPKGIMRTKQFLMCDMCSIDETEESLKKSAEDFENMVESVFKRFNIDTYRIDKNNDGKYIDYLIKCPEGETKIKIKDDKAFYSSEKGYEKSSSIAMYFIYDLIDNFEIKYNGKDNLSNTYFLGTYGFGIQRCLHAIIEQNRNDKGIIFPKEVRPFDFYVIPIEPEDTSQLSKSLEIYHEILDKKARVALDDRNISFQNRANFAEFLGTPYKIFVGKNEINNDFLTLKENYDLKGKKIKSYELKSIIENMKDF
jgi:prolyl-tRNA synthetase